MATHRALMALSDIQAWLQGSRPYRAGIDLLKAHVPDSPQLRMLLTLVNRAENGYSRDRLAEALSAVMKRAQQAPQASPQPAPRPDPSMYAAATVNLVQELDDWPMHKYPVELQELKMRTRHWLAEQDALLGELRQIPEKDKRFQTALRIKELDDMRHSAYHRLDTFRKTGTDIGEVRNAPKTMLELHQELLNVKSYICKIEKGTRTASDEKLKSLRARRDLLQTAINTGLPV